MQHFLFMALEKKGFILKSGSHNTKKKNVYTSSSTFYLDAYKPNQYFILDRD